MEWVSVAPCYFNLSDIKRYKKLHNAKEVNLILDSSRGHPD